MFSGKDIAERSVFFGVLTCRATSLQAITWFPGSEQGRRFCIFPPKHWSACQRFYSSFRKQLLKNLEPFAIDPDLDLEASFRAHGLFYIAQFDALRQYYR
ncbi:hypothetical protein PoB_005235100 [Plakobranchus ocellatus]|uniref:Uncharacterized protein n=1 Tax=Plakobranchus ocellatus TaxID=259542 RepID=A0AAV4C383_9GAST|nr:hypothetical protein PoB_005235100 [Plakobranchus ocellatus]